MTTFKDLFSRQAALYARYRPAYPPELFEYLAALAPSRELAWDCGTGNGQAAVALAPHFNQVVATDPSERQLASAIARSNVRYELAPAEKAPLPAATVDLVSVAQAIHWFRFDEFYAEAKRAMKPGAVIAAWGYERSAIDGGQIDELLRELAVKTLAGCWAPEIRWLWNQYRTLPFPFEEIAPPRFGIASEWSLEALLGYLSSWSATQAYAERTGRNPLDELEPKLRRAWGEDGKTRRVNWEIYLRVGRKSC